MQSVFVNVSCVIPLRGSADVSKTEGVDAPPQLPPPPAAEAVVNDGADAAAPAAPHSSGGGTLDRAALLAQLSAMDPADLKDLLQGMRRFPWEVDGEAQTDEVQPASVPAAVQAPAADVAVVDVAAGLAPAAPRPMFKPAGKSLRFFKASMSNKKAKVVPLRQLKRTIAKILEDKVRADEIDDMACHLRAEMPTFVSDFMLKSETCKTSNTTNIP